MAVNRAKKEECQRSSNNYGADTKTDTNFRVRRELSVTGGEPPVTRYASGVAFIYLRGCVNDRMKTRYRSKLFNAPVLSPQLRQARASGMSLCFSFSILWRGCCGYDLSHDDF